MTNADLTLVDRLAGMPEMAGVPRKELEWMVAHGDLEVYEAGTVVALKGKPIEKLFVVVSGYVTIRVDRGAGPRRVMEWGVGEPTGMLPYSRMTAPPGDSYVEETTELLAIHRNHFTRMISMCPVYTARTVHMMLDRARSFNTSDLQDEKMMSLGKLAAGLAHELNNPASAIMRCAKILYETLDRFDAAARTLGATGIPDDTLASILRFREKRVADSGQVVLSPIERVDREDEIAHWLTANNLDPDCAPSLVDAEVTPEILEALSENMSGAELDTVLRWISEDCAVRSLAIDIEKAAASVYELVSAVKKFTYVGQSAGYESVAVDDGLRDTIRVLSSKATSRNASVTLDVDPDLPDVYATGSELNQVWMNLIDNALDAVPQFGRVDITARRELDRVVVRVIDNGQGIPEEIVDQIFDPFFTTKPPGEGTGLGLDIARRIIRRHDGEIDVQSRPGRTELIVRLEAQGARASSGEHGR